jgi:hypothetical protein
VEKPNEGRWREHRYPGFWNTDDIARPRQLSVTESAAGSRLIKGASVMAHYRAYLIGCDGHSKKAVDLNFTDDNAARKRAEQMVDGHDVELWEHPRRIARFASKQEQPFSPV